MWGLWNNGPGAVLVKPVLSRLIAPLHTTRFRSDVARRTQLVSRSPGGQASGFVLFLEGIAIKAEEGERQGLGEGGRPRSV